MGNFYGLQLLFLIMLACASSSSTKANESQGELQEKQSSSSKCPLWTRFNNQTERCECRNHNFFKSLDYSIECNLHTKSVSVLDCHCLTYDSEEELLEVGSCQENCMNISRNLFDKLYHWQLNNNSIENFSTRWCEHNFKRTGRLCGKCLPPYSPQAYSFNITCVNCPDGNTNLWKYFTFSLVPLTCFYFIVVFFKINTTTSHLHGYIIFSQISSLPQFDRFLIRAVGQVTEFKFPLEFLAVAYGMWNLDFFRAFDLGVCLDMSPLSVIALGYVIAVYPFLLTILSYILIELHDRNFKVIVLVWKPFRCIFTLFRRNWDIRTSVIDAYATFFHLSCFKILSISVDLLTPTFVYSINKSGEVAKKLVVYYDGTVDFFGEDHFPHAFVALFFVLFFIIIPSLFLLVYPCRCFQYVLSRCHYHSHILQTFMDSLNGCYKDGSEPGTRDCRWFAVVDFMTRFAFFIAFSLTLGGLFFPLAVMVILLVIILITSVRPHKTAVAHYTNIDVAFYCLLGLFCTAFAATNTASLKARFYIKGCYIVAVLTAFFPLLYISCLSAYWIFSRRRCGRTFINRVRNWRKGYDLLEDFPDRIMNPDNYDQILENAADI